MKNVLRVLTSWYFLGAVALMAVLTFIYLFGQWMGWSGMVQLSVVVGVLAVLILGLVITLVRAHKKAADIQGSISDSVEKQRMGSTLRNRPEVEALKRDLNTAMNTLKSSKLGRGGRGSAALYALPWYLFIGPPGAGKTIAISNSGLNFPFGIDRVKGVGGTRHCDWFFSDQAIFLDTAGRYMTEQEDEDEWYAFLDMLKENRSSRPINGAIVGISIQELVERPREKVTWHANRIRRRIDELMERLGVRFPVYLVFTKTDLVRGFVEFFDDLSPVEREQVWGYTLTLDGREERDVSEVFSEQFDRLVRQLTSRRSHRLNQPLSEVERERTYVFPLEFSSVKDRLALFVDTLFQPNPFQESPICRGFYFTSGTQEGVPTDYITGRIAGDLDLPEDNRAPQTGGDDASAYFIKDLFSEVIVPDRFIVQRTSRASRKTWLTQTGYMAVALLALGLFSFGAFSALEDSQKEIASVQDMATSVRAASWDDISSDRGTVSSASGETMSAGANTFYLLNDLRVQLSDLEAYEENPPLFDWGLKRSGIVLGACARRLSGQHASICQERSASLHQTADGGRHPEGRAPPRRARRAVQRS